MGSLATNVEICKRETSIVAFSFRLFKKVENVAKCSITRLCASRLRKLSDAVPGLERRLVPQVVL